MKGKNPYVGPRAFVTGEVIHGREREIRELLQLLVSERIVLMYSPSGAGKTSLIQAALVPALIEEDFLVLPVMRVSSELSAQEKETVTVSNRYVLSALLSLEKAWPVEDQVSLSTLANMSFSNYLDSDELRRVAVEAKKPTFRRGKTRQPRVLIFDQFEELLTVDPTDYSAKGMFFEQVGAALRNRDCWALFSMREDFVAGLDPFLPRVPTRLATTMRLDLLGEASGRSAIQEPARRSGVEFRNEAAMKLINDLRTVVVQQADGSMKRQLGLHIEPVQLQVVCRRLWDKLPTDTEAVVEADIESIGDVDEALSGYYADQVKLVAGTMSGGNLNSEGERAIREWFNDYLITEQGIRGQVLQGREESQGLRNDVIHPLIDAHLVRAEKRRGATWFELAHDRLIEPVLRDNAAWLENNLNDFQRLAALWQKQGRQDSLLLHSQALIDANEWSKNSKTLLTPVEEAFLNKSLEVQKRADREQRQQEKFREKRRQARRNRIAAVVMSIISIIAITALVGVIVKEKELRSQYKAVDDARQTEERQRKEIEKQQADLLQLNAQLQQEQVEQGKVSELEKKVRDQQLLIIQREARKIITAVNKPSGGATDAADSPATPPPQIDTKAFEKAIRGLGNITPKTGEAPPKKSN